MPPFRQSNGERSKLFPSGSRHGLQPELRSRQVRPQHGQIASVKHSKVSVAKLSRVRPSQGLAQQRQRDPDAGTAHQDSTDRACGRQRPAREQSKLLAQRGTSVPGSVWVVEVHQTSSNFIHNGAVINTSSQMMTSSLSTAVRRSWRSFLRDRRSPAVRMHNTGAVQSQSDGSVVNLGPDEIRQVQIALKQKGFYIRNRTECWVREPRRR